MPTTTEIRNAIVAQLASVAPASKVQAFERYSKDPQKLAEHYVANGKLAGFLVRRTGFRRLRASTLYDTIVQRWQIRAYASLLDAEASELGFDLLLDQLAAAFAMDDTLGGLVDGMDDLVPGAPVGLQLDDSGPVLFAGILCHSARLSLVTRHDVEIGVMPADDLSTVVVTWDMADRTITGAPGPDGQVDAEDTIQLQQ